ncbi:MAG: hypothetical protein RLZZ60_1182 [Bacteroidota bacterium]
MTNKNLTIKTLFFVLSFLAFDSINAQTFEIRHSANTVCTNVPYTIYNSLGQVIGSGNIGSPVTPPCINGVPAYITYTKCNFLYTLNVNTNQYVSCNPTCGPYYDNVSYVAADPNVDPCEYILTINL